MWAVCLTVKFIFMSHPNISLVVFSHVKELAPWLAVIQCDSKVNVISSN